MPHSQSGAQRLHTWPITRSSKTARSTRRNGIARPKIQRRSTNLPGGLPGSYSARYCRPTMHPSSLRFRRARIRNGRQRPITSLAAAYCSRDFPTKQDGQAKESHPASLQRSSLPHPGHRSTVFLASLPRRGSRAEPSRSEVQLIRRCERTWPSIRRGTCPQGSQAQRVFISERRGTSLSS